MATDPQTWVFPPSGADTPPQAQSSSFGPVSLNDSMVLIWTPASSRPNIYLWCSPFTSAQSFQVCNGASSPFTYTFANAIPSGSYCHMSFLNTQHGNTVVWEWSNEEGGKVWSALGDEVASGPSVSVANSTSGTSVASSSSSVVSSSLSSTSSTTTSFAFSAISAPSTTSVTITTVPASAATSPVNKSASDPLPLSSGVIAAIAIAAAALLIFVAIFTAWRVKQLKRRPEVMMDAQGTSNMVEAPVMDEIMLRAKELSGETSVPELGTERVVELESRVLRTTTGLR